MSSSLFGEPELKSDRSQWFTPMWICRLLARWVPPTANVLEPSCGSGNMIQALIDQGHPPEKITGVELDNEWASFAHERFNGAVQIYNTSFFDAAGSFTMFDGIGPASFAYVIGNPPFENGLHERFIRTCLELKGSPTVGFVLPTSVEYSRERDFRLWAQCARITRRAKLPDRVQYGGKHSASFDSEVLKIVRRTEPRPHDEINHVIEEVWTETISAGLDPVPPPPSQKRTGNRAHSGR